MSIHPRAILLSRALGIYTVTIKSKDTIGALDGN